MASATFSSANSRGRPRSARFRLVRLRARLRRPALVVVSVLAAIALAEFGIRAVEFAADERFAQAGLAAFKLPAGQVVRGRVVNAQGYWDDDFATPTAGKCRVALLGGRTLLSGAAGSDFAAQLERLIPAVEIDHFGLPEMRLARLADQLSADVLPRRPQWVVVCLAPDDVVTSEVPHVFESRVLRMAGEWFASYGRASFTAARLDEPPDYESFVRRRASSIAVCRPGDDADMDRRWRAAQEVVSRLARECRRRDVGVALLLAPAEYQLCPTLAASYCRHQGLDAAKLDLELPQRRWAAYADRLEVPVVDLLPAFRGASGVVFEPASLEWTDRGQELAAQTVARRLQSSFGTATAAK